MWALMAVLVILGYVRVRKRIHHLERITAAADRVARREHVASIARLGTTRSKKHRTPTGEGWPSGKGAQLRLPARHEKLGRSGAVESSPAPANCLANDERSVARRVTRLAASGARNRSSSTAAVDSNFVGGQAFRRLCRRGLPSRHSGRPCGHFHVHLAAEPDGDDERPRREGRIGVEVDEDLAGRNAVR